METAYRQQPSVNHIPKTPRSFWLELDQACGQHQASVSLLCARARPRGHVEARCPRALPDTGKGGRGPGLLPSMGWRMTREWSYAMTLA